MRTRSLFTTMILALAVVACGEAPTPDQYGTSEHAIRGGYVHDGDRGVVGVVRMSNWGISGMCSGTLITPNLVLTAQHCVARVQNQVQGGVSCSQTHFGDAFRADRMWITTSTSLPNEIQGYHQAQQIIIPPGGSQFCGQDIALLVLLNPVPAAEAQPLVPRVDEPVLGIWSATVQNEEYSAMGYGSTDDAGNGSGIRRRRDDLVATCADEQCPGWAQVTNTEWIGDTGVCTGDSGGPAVDLAGRVIGVASRGGQGCTFPVYASIAPWADWLRDSALHAAELGGIEAPLWALGFPTDPRFYAPIGQVCDFNTDCESGFCVSGACTRPCDELAGCPTGWGCNGGRCALHPVGGFCESDGQCPGGSCVDGLCSRGCDEATGCPDGWTCDGACQILPVGPVCEDDVTCSGGLCADGYCTRACGAEAPCPPAYGCDEVSGTCLLHEVGGLCEAEQDCASGLCQAGACTRICDETTPCPSGYACAHPGSCELIAPPDTGCAAGGGSAPLGVALGLLLAFGVAIRSRRRRAIQSTLGT